MSVYRSNNPADFDDIDGIIVDESTPPGSIQGAATNVCILVGQFPSGPLTLTEVDSIGELNQLYGKSTTHSGNLALKNKKFGSLKVIRAMAAAAVKGTIVFPSVTPVDTIQFTAKYFGLRGNSNMVVLYTAIRGLPAEIYDNVVISAVGTTFANSKLVDVAVLSVLLEPVVAAATALATGADGSIANSDYQAALVYAEVENAGNVLFLDEYNSTRNGYIKTHVALTQDKMGILSHAESDSALGRSSRASSSIDPAFAKNVQYTGGATGVKTNYTRAQHIAFKNAGGCAFEYDQDLGIKPKCGVVTQIADTAKLTILRRRMADYLTVSASRFMKNYQNGVNSKENRDSVKGAILAFVAEQQKLKVLPGVKDVESGLPTLVDTDSPNTDLSIGLGYFYVLWKQRIFSSMRYIVLQAQIGETVVVTEAA